MDGVVAMRLVKLSDGVVALRFVYDSNVGISDLF